MHTPPLVGERERRVRSERGHQKASSLGAVFILWKEETFAGTRHSDTTTVSVWRRLWLKFCEQFLNLLFAVFCQ
jgi:hypothetical protein